MEPIGEELLSCGLAHAGDGEVVLLARVRLNSVFVDGSDFVQPNLDAVAGILDAAEIEAAGVESELAGTAAEVLVVSRRVDNGSERDPGCRCGGRRRRGGVRILRKCGSDRCSLIGDLRRDGGRGVLLLRTRCDDYGS